MSALCYVLTAKALCVSTWKGGRGGKERERGEREGGWVIVCVTVAVAVAVAVGHGFIYF